MSPSRAGSSHSTRLVTFLTSARDWKLTEKRAEISILSWIPISYNKNWLKYASKSNYSPIKRFLCYISSDKWSWNWLKSWYRTSDNKTWGISEFKKFAIFFINGNCRLAFSSKIKVPQLGSARKLHSSAWLEPENSSSGSSLVETQSFCCSVVHQSWCKKRGWNQT